MKNQNINLENHLVATIAGTSHLCPLPEKKKPIYWNHDRALSLYPLPDALILGDQYNAFETVYEGMLCFNPGPFHLNYNFYNYEPVINGTEFSTVPLVD